METIYQDVINSGNSDSLNKEYKGGFIIGGLETSSLFNSDINQEGFSNTTKGGGNKRFQNKVIPFGLAIKHTKPYIGHQCKNGDVLNESLFEKLFTMVAKVEKGEKKNNKKNNTTKRIK